MIIPVSFKAPPNNVLALACTIFFADSVLCTISCSWKVNMYKIRVIAKLPNSEQSYKGKVNTHNYINRQNQSTNEKL